jgi:hypothetical protein
MGVVSKTSLGESQRSAIRPFAHLGYHGRLLFLTLTVNWHGTRGNGRAVKGSLLLVVPAYPSFGARVTAQKGVPGILNFGYTIVSN